MQFIVLKLFAYSSLPCSLSAENVTQLVVIQYRNCRILPWTQMSGQSKREIPSSIFLDSFGLNNLHEVIEVRCDIFVCLFADWMGARVTQTMASLTRKRLSS